ncbi:MAG TPA: trimeric intracellular cation channel family protein [Anaerolineaceae bacterium]|jgi:uncharacterized membrane protein YeiH|nr:trimeric intracellular cation channel family protein [Anaerolineaceae bacterium]
MNLDLIILVIAYLGVSAGAVSGVFESRRKDMDVVGATTVALITALGGGTLRDLLLGRAPVFWVKEPGFPLLGFAVAILTFYSTRLLKLTARSILIPDALALGAFTVMGAARALDQGTSVFIAALMGLVTGVFGGVLRDITCNEIPTIFVKDTQLYATCSFVGAWVYIGLERLGAQLWLATIASILVTFAFRMISSRYNWRLPGPRSQV